LYLGRYVFAPIGTYFKYTFYVKIRLFVTLKYDQVPDPDPHWFRSLDPDPDPHWDKKLDPELENALEKLPSTEGKFLLTSPSK
jgi:hypothetical protein